MERKVDMYLCGGLPCCDKDVKDQWEGRGIYSGFRFQRFLSMVTCFRRLWACGRNVCVMVVRKQGEPVMEKKG
jgi:hypothetical protein